MSVRRSPRIKKRIEDKIYSRPINYTNGNSKKSPKNKGGYQNQRNGVSDDTRDNRQIQATQKEQISDLNQILQRPNNNVNDKVEEPEHVNNLHSPRKLRSESQGGELWQGLPFNLRCSSSTSPKSRTQTEEYSKGFLINSPTRMYELEGVAISETDNQCKPTEEKTSLVVKLITEEQNKRRRSPVQSEDCFTKIKETLYSKSIEKFSSCLLPHSTLKDLDDTTTKSVLNDKTRQTKHTITLENKNNIQKKYYINNSTPNNSNEDSPSILTSTLQSEKNLEDSAMETTVEQNDCTECFSLHSCGGQTEINNQATSTGKNGKKKTVEENISTRLTSLHTISPLKRDSGIFTPRIIKRHESRVKLTDRFLESVKQSDSSEEEDSSRSNSPVTANEYTCDLESCTSTRPLTRKYYSKSPLKNYKELVGLNTKAKSPRKLKTEELLKSMREDPRLASNACMLWSSEQRRSYQLRNPTANSEELDSLMRQAWLNLDDQTAYTYFSRAYNATVTLSASKSTTNASGITNTSVTAHQSAAQGGRTQVPTLQSFTNLSEGLQLVVLRKQVQRFQKVLAPVSFLLFYNEYRQACKSLLSQMKCKYRGRGRPRKITAAHEDELSCAAVELDDLEELDVDSRLILYKTILKWNEFVEKIFNLKYFFRRERELNTYMDTLDQLDSDFDLATHMLQNGDHVNTMKIKNSINLKIQNDRLYDLDKYRDCYKISEALEYQDLCPDLFTSQSLACKSHSLSDLLEILEKPCVSNLEINTKSHDCLDRNGYLDNFLDVDTMSAIKNRLINDSETYSQIQPTTKNLAAHEILVSSANTEVLPELSGLEVNRFFEDNAHTLRLDSSHNYLDDTIRSLLNEADRKVQRVTDTLEYCCETCSNNCPSCVLSNLVCLDFLL